METVAKKVGEKRTWRDGKLNAQNQLAKHKNPVVLTQQIISEIGVRMHNNNHRIVA